MSFVSFLIVCRTLMTNTSFGQIFWQLLAQPLSQNTGVYVSLDRLLRYSKTNIGDSLVIVVTIWVLMAAIISKTFSEGLLSTYFGREVKPMVETFDEIINKKGLKVIMQQRDKPKFREFMPDVFDKLYSNGQVEFVDRMPINSQAESTAIAKSVAKGSKVVLISSFSTDFFLDYFMDLPLTIGGRHSMNFLVLSMSRRHPFGKKITQL